MTRAHSALLDIIGQKLPLVAFVLGVVLLVTGFCDVDWMVNMYHNFPSSDIWYFNTWLAVEWWDAYAVSMIRVIVGSWLLGICTVYFNANCAKIYYEKRYRSMV